MGLWDRNEVKSWQSDRTRLAVGGRCSLSRVEARRPRCAEDNPTLSRPMTVKQLRFNLIC